MKYSSKTPGYLQGDRGFPGAPGSKGERGGWGEPGVTGQPVRRFKTLKHSLMNYTDASGQYIRTYR